MAIDIEKTLESLGFTFYNDEAFDYWYKDGVLFYVDDNNEWCARLSKANRVHKNSNLEFAGIETKEDILEAIKSLNELK